MKTRTGFVSNSSSASFAVPLSVLTPKQIVKIKDYYNVVLSMTVPQKQGDKHWEPRRWKKQIKGMPSGTYLDQSWEIKEGSGMLLGETSIDNLDFSEFLIRLGVPKDAIVYGQRLSHEN